MMSTLTVALFGALVVYLGGWYLGHWVGNFSLLLFLLSVVTGVYWLAERLYFAPSRARAAQALTDQDGQRRADLARKGITKVDGDVEAARQQILTQPWWLDWTAGLFPVILIVFLLRSFLFEPFKIPSGSMIPTLIVGDLILVNKFHYGVRLPVINVKVVNNNEPKLGDVIVFRYPLDTRIDYIKRVVGLPGDEVSYLNQKLSVNGQLVEIHSEGPYYDPESIRYAPRFSEKLGTVKHGILVQPDVVPPLGPLEGFQQFRDQCRYSAEGVVCKVPAGHYFVMGDNRDNSQDSRYWGFVPDQNIVGRAFWIWMNFGNLRRFGGFD